jgi:hypothetical protein
MYSMSCFYSVLMLCIKVQPCCGDIDNLIAFVNARVYQQCLLKMRLAFLKPFCGNGVSKFSDHFTKSAFLQKIMLQLQARDSLSFQKM